MNLLHPAWYSLKSCNLSLVNWPKLCHFLPDFRYFWFKWSPKGSCKAAITLQYFTEFLIIFTTVTQQGSCAAVVKINVVNLFTYLQTSVNYSLLIVISRVQEKIYEYFFKTHRNQVSFWSFELHGHTQELFNGVVGILTLHSYLLPK